MTASPRTVENGARLPRGRHVGVDPFELPLEFFRYRVIDFDKGNLYVRAAVDDRPSI